MAHEDPEFEASGALTFTMKAKNAEEAAGAARMRLYKLSKEPLLDGFEIDPDSISVERVED